MFGGAANDFSNDSPSVAANSWQSRFSAEARRLLLANVVILQRRTDESANAGEPVPNSRSHCRDAAVAFGLLQVRQFRVQRRDAAGAELVRSFQDTQFIQVYQVLSAVPAEATAEEFRAAGPAAEAAALTLGMRYELIGLLVFREIMPLSLVAQSTGSVAIQFWGKMHAWILEKRDAEGQPHLLEWFQWLIDQLEKRGRRAEPPAFACYRDWRAPAE
jgi:hypothetical protein